MQHEWLGFFDRDLGTGVRGCSVRRTGRYLLAGGSGIFVLTFFVFVSSNAAKDEFEVIDTTPYFVWAAVGALALVLGAVFFAAGEVVRVLSPSETAPKYKVGSRSHYE